MKSKPTKLEATPMPAVQRNLTGQIWSPVRNKWLFETPEERVRQEFLCVLAAEYGCAVDQIGEEEDLTGRGSAQARADHVVWRKPALLALRLPNPPLAVQHELVADMQTARRRASELRGEADTLRAKARATLEAALLGHPLPESTTVPLA